MGTGPGRKLKGFWHLLQFPCPGLFWLRSGIGPSLFLLEKRRSREGPPDITFFIDQAGLATALAHLENLVAALTAAVHVGRPVSDLHKMDRFGTTENASRLGEATTAHFFSAHFFLQAEFGAATTSFHRLGAHEQGSHRNDYTQDQFSHMYLSVSISRFNDLRA